MRTIFAIALLAAGLAVTGCETAQRSSQVTDEQRRYWTDVVQRLCVLVTIQNTYVLYRNRVGDDIRINEVKYGEGGWVRVDFVSQAIGGNIYYNLKTRRYYCGMRSWQESGLTFIPASGPPKTPASRRWETYDPSKAGPYVSCRSAAGNVSQMAESLCISFGGTVVGRSAEGAAVLASGAGGAGAGEPAPLNRPVYRPSRAVTLVKCRFPDGTVIGEDLTRCTKVGGEIVGEIEAPR